MGKLLKELFVLALCLGLAKLLLKTMYQVKGWLYLILLPATLLLYFAWQKMSKSKVEARLVQDFLILLEQISTLSSQGLTLERSFILARIQVEEQIGQKSLVSKALANLENGLNSGLSFTLLCQNFPNDFPCFKAKTFFNLLSYLDRQGSDLDEYIRQIHRSFLEEETVSKEIRAKQAAKTTEALIMSFLPFIIAYFLGKSSYASQISKLGWAVYLYVFIYLLAICLILINVIIVHRSSLNKAYKPYQLRARMIPQLVQRLANHSLNYDYAKKLAQALRQLSPEMKNSWPKFVYQKLLILLISLLCSMLVLYLLQLNLLFALLIALVINFLYDSEIKLRVKKLEERYKQEYPELLNIFAILLNSGLSLQKTLEELVSIYSQKQYLGSLVYLDLQRIKNEIKLGLDPRATLDQLILRLPSQELKNSLYLIRRYEEEGSLELLKLISLAASSTWQAYFNARRKSLEENAILLLLPMGMDLLIIMLIAIIPAIASFQGI